MKQGSLLAVSILAVASLTAPAAPRVAQAAESDPLQLRAKIPLSEVKGRIDHLAVDLAGQHLFVAELGNGSVGIVDLGTSQVSGRIHGLKEPQGVACLDSTDTLYVASAGDGSVRLFQGQDLKEASHIQLGQDADNIRVGSDGNQVFVGYGERALAVIDAGGNAKVGDIALHGHPESFRLLSGGSRIFVNVPDAHAIEVADRERGEVVVQWTTSQARENYPMALDEVSGQVLVVFRKPATLTAFRCSALRLAGFPCRVARRRLCDRCALTACAARSPCWASSSESPRSS